MPFCNQPLWRPPLWQNGLLLAAMLVAVFAPHSNAQSPATHPAALPPQPDPRNYDPRNYNPRDYNPRDYDLQMDYTAGPAVGYPTETAYSPHFPLFSSQSVWLPALDQAGLPFPDPPTRAIGLGEPLKGTSWLNRPYEFGLDTGALVMGNNVASTVHRQNDLLAAVHLGWDWNHYWGTQLRLAWSTPNLTSAAVTSSGDGSNLLLYDLSLMHYPWGDSRLRPYTRMGLGLTDFDFINSSGVQEENTLLTVPLGIGIKYQTRRWLAWRAEVTDYIGFGQNSSNTMQNFTLTFGLEWRLGGRPQTGWSAPSRRYVE